MRRYPQKKLFVLLIALSYGFSASSVYAQEIKVWSAPNAVTGSADSGESYVDETEDAAYQAEGDFDYSTFTGTSDIDAEQAFRNRSRYLKGLVMRAEQYYLDGMYQQSMQQLNAVFVHEPYNNDAQNLKAKIEHAIIKQQGKRNKLFYKSPNSEQEQIRRSVKKIKQLYRARNYDAAISLCKDVLFMDPDNRTASKYYKKSENKKRVQEKKKRSSRATAAVAMPTRVPMEREQAPLDDASSAPKRVAPAPSEYTNSESMVTFEPVVSDPIVSSPAIESSTLTKEEAQEAAMRALLGMSDTPSASEEPTLAPMSFGEPVDALPATNKPEIEIFDIEEAPVQQSGGASVSTQLKNARVAMRHKDYDAAVSIYYAVLEREPGNRAAKRGLKKAQRKQRKYGSAAEKNVPLLMRETEEGMRTLSAKTTGAVKNLFTTLAPKKKPLTTEEKQAKELVQEAKTQYKARAYEAAISLYEEALAIDPDSRDASYGIDRAREKMILRGHDEYKEKRKKQKQDILEKIDFYTTIARKQQVKGEYASAKIMIQKALLLDPQNKELVEMKKENDAFFRESLSADKQAVGIAPQDSDQVAGEVGMYINRAIKEYLRGDNDKAVEYFEKVLELDPHDQKARSSILRIKQER